MAKATSEALARLKNGIDKVQDDQSTPALVVSL